MNAVTTITQGGQLGPVSQRALAYAQANRNLNRDELGGAITTGFGILSYRGKIWRIKYQGNEMDHLREVNGVVENNPTVEVVLIRAAGNLSKNWYETGYVEGSNAPPDCFSTNGLNADPTSPKRQGIGGSGVCATCPHNQFGSAQSQNGQPGKGKSCADTKRIAIVPLGDIDNDALGGPMLLRIPAASLGDLKNFAETMERNGYPYYAIGVRLAFESKDAYPHIILKAIRPLSDEEVDKVLALREDPRVMRILSAADVEQGAAAPAANEPLFEQELPPVPQTAAPAPVAQPAPTPAPAAAAPQAAPAETPEQMQARLRDELMAEMQAKAAAEAKAKAENEAREAEAARQAAAQAAAPAETEAQMRERLMREMAAQMAPPVAQAAPAAAPAPTPAPTTPAPTPAAAAPATAPQTPVANGQVAEAPVAFDSLLDSLIG